MAIACNLFLFISPFLFLQFHVFYKAETAEIRHQYHDVAWNQSLTPQTVCCDSLRKDLIKRSHAAAVILRLSHRDGPCSPLFKNQRNEAASTSDPSSVFLQDQLRVRYLHSKISYKSKSSAIVDPKADVDKLPATRGTGNFIVTVGLGTPKRDLSLEFDTGSDLTWTKCVGCSQSQCDAQEEFDPSQSSSYSTVPCGSDECSQFESATPCSSTASASCTYFLKYGDGSSTTGVYARETLTLGPQDVLPNFLFGCGLNNEGLERTAGLLGLGRDQTSLVSQSSQKFGRVFSYCLPSTKSSTGYLAFGASGGDEAVRFTPLLSNSRPFYYISLEGISVGGQRLPISPSVFETSGTIIDSGTVITRLPPSAYASLRDAFREAMSQNNYPSAQPVLSLFDTCYDLSGRTETMQVPNIALHFGGNVDLELDQSLTLVEAGESQVCLAFAGNEDESQVAILGNTQQISWKVVYDFAGNRIGFGPKGCA